MNIYTASEKPLFIEQIMQVCKDVKKMGRYNGGIVVGKIEGEKWSFLICVRDRKIYTSATLWIDGGSAITYPETKWGGVKRWDRELREFLEREILKQ